MRWVNSFVGVKLHAVLALGLVFAATPTYAADTVAPTTPGSFTNTSTTVTSASFTWTASTDNVAVTAYLLERCTGVGCSNFAQVVSTPSLSYTNTGLAVQTTYNYRVRARDAANNKSAYSPVITVVTPADTQAPTVPTNVAIAVISMTQLNVSWTAATDDVKVTGYLVERCLGTGCTAFAQVSTPTAVTYNNTGLVPNTNYSYRVRAKDAANNLSAYSAVASATTLPDVQAPTVPGTPTLTVNSNTKITVTWTAATDDIKVTGYRVERCQGTGCTNFIQVATPAGVSYANAGLLAGSSYSYRIAAVDAAGNVSGYTPIVTAVTTGVDATAPSVPSNLTATPISDTQINLAWTASTDNLTVTNYFIERCQGAGCATFAQIATSANPTYNDTTLTQLTSYTYRVRATDAANKVSGYSNLVTTSTPSLTDTQAPTAPTGLTATAISTTQIDLSWTASNDLFGVTGYLIERCQGTACATFTQFATFSGTSFSNLSLAVSTSYSYRVRATDAANNLSDYSNIAVAITHSPPPVTFSYSYDSLGRLTQATGTDGSQINYQYDANGNMTTMVRQ